MSATDITAERLASYGVFSANTIEVVAGVADQNAQYGSFGDYVDAERIPTPFVTYLNGRPEQILDIDLQPDEHDPDHATEFYLPIDNSLVPHQIIQLGTIACANPGMRLITHSNPGAVTGFSYGSMSALNCWKIFKGDFSPLIENRFRYAQSRGIQVLDDIGFSLGGDLAVEAGGSDDFGVDNITTIDAAANHKWHVPVLGKVLMTTLETLDGYVAQTDWPAYAEAFDLAPGDIPMGLGFARPTNIANAFGLSKGGYEKRAKRALDTHPNALLTSVRGSDSELAIDGIMQAIDERMAEEYGQERYRSQRIPGGRHMMVNDIYLQAAIVREARTRTLDVPVSNALL